MKGQLFLKSSISFYFHGVRLLNRNGLFLMFNWYSICQPIKLVIFNNEKYCIYRYLFFFMYFLLLTCQCVPINNSFCFHFLLFFFLDETSINIFFYILFYARFNKIWKYRIFKKCHILRNPPVKLIFCDWRRKRYDLQVFTQWTWWRWYKRRISWNRII